MIYEKWYINSADPAFVLPIASPLPFVFLILVFLILFVTLGIDDYFIKQKQVFFNFIKAINMY